MVDLMAHMRDTPRTFEPKVEDEDRWSTTSTK